jgi:argininosuccinate synthase
MKKKVILAYSGGLDTSVILHWLIQKDYDVICFIANVGQNEDFNAVEQKEFEGKDIVDVLPLSQVTREMLVEKFNLAAKENKTVDAIYNLENVPYATEIIPLSNQKDGSYFVNVWR